jgi:CIC family chloride channel protein
MTASEPPAETPIAQPPRGPIGRLRAAVRSSNFALALLALVVGAAAGVMVMLMSRAVQWIHVILFGIDLNERLSGAAHIAPWRVLAWPPLGGLVLGLAVWWMLRRGRAPAVDPIEANALHGGRMSIFDSLVVAAQTLISNGFGASVGLEAGYTQLGSGFASGLGARLKLRRQDLRVLVGAGSAGAIAAAFAAPLTGAFYGFEVVIGSYSIASVAPVMAAAIAGALVTQQIGGSLYHIEAVTAASVRGLQYGLFILLGVVCAVLAIVLMRGVSTVERLFKQPWAPQALRPAIGGLAVGAMALYTPQVLSAGHGALQYDLGVRLGATMVLTLLVLKMMAAALSLGSGFRGGLFFASLLLGALTGQLFADLLAMAGWTALNPTAAALVGMGAFAVAIVGGPLTMSFLVLETTGDYALTGAVLAASIMSSLIVRETFGYSFSTFRLHLRGESIRSAHDVGRIRSLTVGRLMRRDPPSAPIGTTVKEFRRRYPLGSAQQVVLVDEDGRYAGLVGVDQLHAGNVDEESPAEAYAAFGDCMLVPAMNIKDAMAAFDRTEAEALAVVDAPESRQLLGVLKETFAIRRYAEELDQSRRELVGEPAPQEVTP